MARITVGSPGGVPCGWREALVRNLTKALLTPWAAGLVVALAAPNSDAAPAIAMLAVLAGLVVAVVHLRIDGSSRSVGDRLAGTVVVRRASKTAPARRVPRPVAIAPTAAAGRPAAAVAVAAAGRVRRPRVRLTPAPWGLRDVGLGASIGVGPLIAFDLLRPFHLSPSAGLGAGALVFTAILVQDSWITGWAWGFSLRRYGLRRGDWGFRRPGLAILWLVPLALVICVVAEFVLAPFAHGRSRSIADFFPHTTAGGLLLLLLSCVVAPVMEEIFCRGFLFRGLLKGCGPWWAAIVSAAAFAALHWNLSSFVPIFVAGLCLAWLYYRTNSLWTSIALHASINGVAFIVWLLL